MDGRQVSGGHPRPVKNGDLSAIDGREVREVGRAATEKNAATKNNKGDYIQIYTNGKPKLYNLVSPDRSPRQGGGLGVGPICKRGFAARIPTDGDVNPLANLIRCKKYIVTIIKYVTKRYP